MRCEADTSYRYRKLTTVDARCVKVATMEVKGKFYCNKHGEEITARGNEFRELPIHERRLEAMVRPQLKAT